MPRRLLATTVAALSFCAGIASAESPHFGAKLEVRGGRLFMPVSVNGTWTEALLDSAAEMTFIDPVFAAKLKLQPRGAETVKGSGGHAQVQFADGVDILTDSGTLLKGRTVALLDMNDLSKHLVRSELTMILGREFFDAGRYEIDIAGGTLRNASGDRPEGLKLSLRSARGIESVRCRVEGVKTWADIDLGNGSEVLIGRKFAEARGLLAPGRVVERKEGGGIGGPLTRDIVVLKTLELGGVTFEDVRAAIDPQDSAGAVNVGTNILQRFKLTIDFPKRAIWFQPH